MTFPENLQLLHTHEETLRLEAVRRIGSLPNMTLHFALTESAMDLFDLYRQHPSDDEDVKTMQAIGCRVFNAFASATSLMLAGYYQSSAMLLRDILESVFLVSYFSSEPSAIARWRTVPEGKVVEEFKPVTIRMYLDRRDGFKEQKRAAAYKLLSQLAGHPTALSFAMLRPKGMDIRNGPFLDITALEAVASEMGKLAVQIGGAYGQLLPSSYDRAEPAKGHFRDLRQQWLLATGFITENKA